jgi:hypothetical protein
MASPQGDNTATLQRSPSRSSVSNEKKVDEDPEKLVVPVVQDNDEIPPQTFKPNTDLSFLALLPY